MFTTRWPPSPLHWSTASALKEAVAALGTLVPADKRGQVVRVGNITVINDCYNSNPKALAAMVDALATMPARRRIVVAGEMLELGRWVLKCIVSPERTLHAKVLMS